MTGLQAAILISIAVIAINIEFARTALPDPFSISWTLVNASIGVSGSIGYAYDKNIGHIFGMDQTPTNARLNFTDGSLTPYPNLPQASSSPCVVSIPNGDVFIMGGFPAGVTFGSPYNTVYKLAAGANAYTTMAPMNEGRLFHSCTYDAPTNRIYVMGGSTSNGQGIYSILQSGEYYSIEHNNWTVIASRSDNVYLFSVISVGDGNIYTFNGINVPQTIRQYSIADDSWTTIGYLNKSNSGQIAAYYEQENIVFLFGGRSFANDGCEYFNFTSKTAVPFDCPNSNGTTINDQTIVGAFIPATGTFYAVSTGTSTLWSANIPLPPVAATPIDSTPVFAPTSETAPSSSDGPLSQPINAPSHSPTRRISEATGSTSVIGFTIASVMVAVAYLV